MRIDSPQTASIARTLGAGGAWSVHGRILLGHVSVRRHGHFRVRFNQIVRVRRHRESFSFTNVYRAC